MKTLYQVADLSLAEHPYEEIDSSDWHRLTVPIHTVCIQGITASSFKEFAVEEVGEEVKLYFWHPPRYDYENRTVLTGHHGFIYTFPPLYKGPNQRDRWEPIITWESFFETADHVFDVPVAPEETRRRWSDFVMPAANLVKQGVDSHDDDALYADDRDISIAAGWQGWIVE